ncbi:MAG: hypothetical protein IMW94_02075 [Thermoanaerobacter sp.]|nr:hypothetical protein [Thermoanaerobacter sp.]
MTSDLYIRRFTETVRPGMVMVHIPTGKEVQVNAVGENYFEVICLHDGARWKLALENVKEFCLLY